MIGLRILEGFAALPVLECIDFVGQLSGVNISSEAGIVR